jgi:prefoldin subunit 5
MRIIHQIKDIAVKGEFNNVYKYIKANDEAIKKLEEQIASLRQKIKKLSEVSNGNQTRV